MEHRALAGAVLLLHPAGCRTTNSKRRAYGNKYPFGSSNRETAALTAFWEAK
jgi:hypothetical protein